MKVMTTYTDTLRHTLLLSLLLLLPILTGCRQDRLTGDEITPEAEAVLHLTIHQPESDPILRSTEGGDTEAETRIETLDIYLYKGDHLDTTGASTTAPEYHERITVGKSSGILHRAISYKDASATYQVLVVANAKEGWLTGEEKVSDLTDKVVEDRPTIAGPYLMTGRSRDLTPATDHHVDVVLSRIVSKINITNATPEDNQFEILAIVPIRTEKSFLFAHVFPFTTGDNERADTPLTPDGQPRMIEEEKVTMESQSSTVTLLTYESELPNTLKNNIGGGVLIQARYNGETCWYRFALMDRRGRRIVRRNSIYTVEIEEVHGKGYNTPEEAIRRRPVNMILGVTTLERSIKKSEQIITDGEYFISSTRAFVHHGTRASYEYEVNGTKYATDPNDRQFTEDITVRTNIPDFRSFTILESKYSFAGDGTTPYSFVDPDNISWITSRWEDHVSVGDDDLGFGVKDLKYDFRGLYIDDRWGGATEQQLIDSNYKRSVEYKIGVSNYPNLFLRISIDQTPDEVLRDQLLLYPSLISADSRRDQVFEVSVDAFRPGNKWEIVGISYLTGTAPEYQSWVSYSPTSGVVGKDRKILLTTRMLPWGQNTGEALIKVKLTDTHTGDMIDLKTIRVTSGQALDYDIIYPEGSPRVADLSRTFRVIETPLDQVGDLTYSINVRSVTPWHVQRPEKDDGWITLSDPSIGTDTGTSGVGYNGSFTVTVKENRVEPLNGLYKARQSLVRIISERASLDILVYQGGYVVIGDTKWIDRNLMQTARKRMTDSGDSYFELPEGYRDTAIEDLLYPAAVPIAFEESTLACYAMHRGTVTKIAHPGAQPTIDHGYQNKNYYTYYAPRGLNPQRDGYFGGCMPASLMAMSYFYDKNSAPENAWNASADMDNSKARDPMKEPTTKGTYDPCPKGWRTVSYREADEMLRYLAYDPHFYRGGVEDTFVYSDDPDAKRAQDKTFKTPLNNGTYFINDDDVNVWFPYAGYRQASNDVVNGDGTVFSQLLKPGYEGRYWMNFFYGDGNSMFLTIKTTKDGSLQAAILPDNAFFGASVRCVEDKNLEALN